MTLTLADDLALPAGEAVTQKYGFSVRLAALLAQEGHEAFVQRVDLPATPPVTSIESQVYIDGGRQALANYRGQP